MAFLEALPAPAGGDTQHGFGQCAQIVGDLFDRDTAFHVARQGAEHLGVVGTAQQVEQGFVVVLAGDPHGLEAALQLGLEICGHKSLGQHRVVGQLVDHTGVLHQVTRWPFGRTHDVQQPLVDGRALQQQRQVTLAAQQWLHPVGHLDGSGFGHAALFDPCACTLYEPHQPGTHVVAQRLHPRVFAPLGHTSAEQGGQFWQQYG